MRAREDENSPDPLAGMSPCYPCGVPRLKDVSDRLCSKPACAQVAAATVTLDYDGSTVAIGPLAPDYAGEGYDLCLTHARRLTPARGWHVIRHVELRDEP